MMLGDSTDDSEIRRSWAYMIILNIYWAQPLKSYCNVEQLADYIQTLTLCHLVKLYDDRFRYSFVWTKRHKEVVLNGLWEWLIGR